MSPLLPFWVAGWRPTLLVLKNLRPDLLEARLRVPALSMKSSQVWSWLSLVYRGLARNRVLERARGATEDTFFNQLQQCLAHGEEGQRCKGTQRCGSKKKSFCMLLDSYEQVCA